MNSVYVTLLIFTFYVYKGNTQEPRSSGLKDFLSNGIDINETTSGRQTGYGLIRFDGPVDHDSDKHEHQFVTFAEDGQSNRPLKFEDESGPSHSGIYNNLVNPNAIPTGVQNNVSFQDDSSQNTDSQGLKQGSVHKKKRRRRRRKPRRFMGDHVRDIIRPSHYGAALPIAPNQPTSENPSDSARPLQAISEALDSILEHDTKRCVKRMLCEQAASSGQINNSTLMRTLTSVFQYLPLLKTNTAINAFPLFKSVGSIMVAMRYGAMFHNESACVQHYPECPSDVEERIHYLNNHNGGLFRFFMGNDKPQYTAQEFHDHLLQLGLKPQPHYAPGQYNPYQPFPLSGPNGQQLAYPYPGQYQTEQQSYPNAAQYGLSQPGYGQNSPPNQGPYKYGFSQPNEGQVYPNQASNSIYSPAYPHYRRSNSNGNDRSNTKDSENSSNEIQKRIQNKPEMFIDDINDNNFVNSKWSFPKIEPTVLNVHNGLNKVRDGRHLKFPDKEVQKEQDTGKQAKGFMFPGAQSNRQNLLIFSDDVVDDDLKVDSTDYEDRYVNEDEGLEIVYVVRGNGDPARPEIIKLRPGEKLYLTK